VRSEVALLGAIGAYKLIAKYDVLIVHAGGRVVILDWKTSETRASERSLRDRLQTRIYPFLVVQAGASLNGGELLKPSDVEMVYWFPEHPDAPARFAYSARQYEDDGAYLHRLVERIAALDDDAYDLTDEAWRCAFCAYRSYCERGEKAGALDDLDEAGRVLRPSRRPMVVNRPATDTMSAEMWNDPPDDGSELTCGGIRR